MTRKCARQRSGKIAVLVAVMLPTVLIPLLAIGVDGGNLMNSQREVQAAVDAAVLQAARELYLDNRTHRGNTRPLDNTEGAKAAALARLDAHDLTSAACQSRTVNIPATSTNPRVNGKPGTVEVVVSYLQQRSFSRIWGTSDLVVTARAVARIRSFSQGAGIIILEESDDQALYGRGGGTLIVNDGGVAVNSDGLSAAQTDGSTTVLAATGFDVAGDYTGDGFYLSPYPGSGATVPYTGSVPVTDPLRDVPEPNPSDYTHQTPPPNGGPSGSAITLKPGHYSQRLFYDGPRTIVLEPGIYYLEKGMGLQGQVALKAEGVMIYNVGSGSDNIELGGGSQWALTPPTSGPYQGIAIFQSRNTADPTTTSVLRGNGGAGVKGEVYTPTTQTRLTGGGTQALGSRFITRTLEMDGSGLFTIDYPSARPDELPNIELVE